MKIAGKHREPRRRQTRLFQQPPCVGKVLERGFRLILRQNAAVIDAVLQQNPADDLSFALCLVIVDDAAAGHREHGRVLAQKRRRPLGAHPKGGFRRFAAHTGAEDQKRVGDAAAAAAARFRFQRGKGGPRQDRCDQPASFFHAGHSFLHFIQYTINQP